MSRAATMTAAAVRSAYEREAVEDFVQLLELYFPGEDMKRFCNQAVEHKLDDQGFEEEDQYGAPVMGIYHKGEFYYYLPFSLPGLSQEDGKAPDSTLAVEGMTAALIPELRALRGTGRASLIEIHMSDPDIEQGRIDDLKLGDISGDQENDSLSAPLTVGMLTDVAYPCDSFTPDRYPGMF